MKWISDLNNARGCKGHELNYLVCGLSCSIFWDTYWKFTIELGLGWTWQIDCEALPTGRGNSSTGLVPTLYQAGEPLGCAYRFAAFMQQPGWPIFPSKGSQQQWGLRTNQTMKMVWYIFWKLGRHQLPQLQLGFQRYFWSFMFRWLVVGRFAVHPHA